MFPDETVLSVASHLGQYCLLMSKNKHADDNESKQTLYCDTYDCLDRNKLLHLKICSFKLTRDKCSHYELIGWNSSQRPSVCQSTIFKHENF